MKEGSSPASSRPDAQRPAVGGSGVSARPGSGERRVAGAGPSARRAPVVVALPAPSAGVGGVGAGAGVPAGGRCHRAALGSAGSGGGAARGDLRGVSGWLQPGSNGALCCWRCQRPPLVYRGSFSGVVFPPVAAKSENTIKSAVIWNFEIGAFLSFGQL